MLLGLQSAAKRLVQHQARQMCTAMTEAEKQIADKLRAQLKVSSVDVRDTSGGCGAMYQIQLVAEDFKSMSVVKQHQLVHKILKDDIAKWHGIQLSTQAP